MLAWMTSLEIRKQKHPQTRLRLLTAGSRKFVWLREVSGTNLVPRAHSSGEHQERRLWPIRCAQSAHYSLPISFKQNKLWVCAHLTLNMHMLSPDYSGIWRKVHSTTCDVTNLHVSRFLGYATNTGWIDLSTGLSILTIDCNLTELIRKNVISFWCKIGGKTGQYTCTWSWSPFHNFSLLKIETFQVKRKDVRCRR